MNTYIHRHWCLRDGDEPMMKGKVVHPPRLRKRAVAAAAASVSMEAIEVSMNDDLSHSVYAKKKKLLTYLSC